MLKFKVHDSGVGRLWRFVSFFFLFRSIPSSSSADSQYYDVKRDGLEGVGRGGRFSCVSSGCEE